LLGYDHERGADDAAVMRAREEEAMERLGVRRGEKYSKGHRQMIAPPPTDALPPQAAQPPPPPRAATPRLSVCYAFAGIRYLIWTQRNAKIQSVLGLAAVGLGLLLPIERGEWLALVLAIVLVLAAEGVNTAVEAAVDLASPAYHPLAKIAKDVA